MDALNLQMIVNLSGGSGQRLQRRPGRDQGALPHALRRVRHAVLRRHRRAGLPRAHRRSARARREKNGAVGLKIFKNLGMFLVDSAGKRVHTDDPRLDPIWSRAGELEVPVLIHTGEPSPFWPPLDSYNERWLELDQFPDRRRDDPRFASFEQTMGEQHDLFRKHPKTNFIAAHLGWLGQRPGPARQAARRDAQRLRRDRRGAGRARPPAARRARLPDQVPGPRADGQGRNVEPTSTTSTSACWRPRTSTSTTTASATPSGRCTASACPTRC